MRCPRPVLHNVLLILGSYIETPDILSLLEFKRSWPSTLKTPRWRPDFAIVHALLLPSVLF